MRKLFYIPLLAVMLFLTNPLTAGSKIQGIRAENRPLVRVHTETITVLDLQKRLDLSIAESNPELLNNIENKYTYYLQNWAPMLNKMINNKLIAAEGAKLKIMVSDCDVNEQITERFGASPLTILSSCHITMKEAKALVFEDLVVNGMSWHRVYTKTQQQLTPSLLKKTYVQYKESAAENSELCYQFITIRAQEIEEAEALSDQLQSLITINQINHLSELPQLLKDTTTLPDTVTFSISEPVTTKKNDLSEDRLLVLSNLNKLTISDPIAQDSKANGKTIRYYQLLDESINAVPSYAEIETTLKNTLFESISNNSMEQYILRLKQEFFFDEQQLEDLAQEQFMPFAAY